MNFNNKTWNVDEMVNWLSAKTGDCHKVSLRGFIVDELTDGTVVEQAMIWTGKMQFAVPVKDIYKIIMTEDEALARMEEIQKDGDTEAMHGDMDDLFCEILKQNGYERLVEIFKNTPKWYA